MRLISCVRLQKAVQSRPPFILGQEETRFPPRMVVFEAGVAQDVSDAHGNMILEWSALASGVTCGIVQVKAGQTDEDALLSAKKMRMDWCYIQLKAYREEQARRRAQQLEIILPRDEHRLWLKEYRTLREELGQDEVLTADLPGVSDTPLGPDPIAEEMRVFGLGTLPAQQGAPNDIFAGL